MRAASPERPVRASGAVPGPYPLTRRVGILRLRSIEPIAEAKYWQYPLWLSVRKHTTGHVF